MPDAKPLRLGTIDLNRVFAASPKTAEANRKIEAARAEMEQESEKRRQALRQPPATASAAHEQRALAGEYREWQKQHMDRFHEMANQLRSGIVEDIKRVVKAKAGETGLDLVIDAGKISHLGTPVVLYVREEYDLTDEIIAALNGGDAGS